METKKSHMTIIKNRFLQDIGLTILSALLVMLAMPGIMQAGVFAWIALVPILFLLNRIKTIKRALFFGSIFGIFFWTIGNLWFLGTDPWQRAGWAVLSLVWGPVQFAWIFALLVFVRRRSDALFLWSFAPAWILSSYLVREKLFSAPFMNFAETQYEFSSFIQIADIGGIYLVSLIILLVNVSLFVLLRYFREGVNPGRSGWVLCLTASILFIVSLGYGLTRTAEDTEISTLGENRSISILTIQPNFRYEYGVMPDNNYRIEQLKLLTRDALGKSELTPDLIVWPETAVLDFIFAQDPDSSERIRVTKRDPAKNIIDFHKEIGETPIMFGSFLAWKSWPEPPALFYNTMFLLTSGENMRWYNKNFPLFMVETAPPAIINVTRSAGLKAGPQQGQKIRGEVPSSFSVNGANFGMLICSENSITNLARYHSSEGVDFFLNPNDNSSIDSIWETHQHSAVSRFRAVENRKYMLSSGNVGPTQLISPEGKVIESIPVYKQGWMDVGIPVLDSAEKTLYTKYGNLIVWVSFFWLISTVVAIKFRKD